MLAGAPLIACSEQSRAIFHRWRTGGNYRDDPDAFVGEGVEATINIV
jgi:hypothetical protein